MKNLKMGLLALTSITALSTDVSAAEKAETIECKFTETANSTKPRMNLGTIKLNLHECHPDSLDSEKKLLKKSDGQTIAVSLELYCSMVYPSMNLIDVKMFEDGKLKSTLALSSFIPEAGKGMSIFAQNATHEISCKVQ